MRGWHVSHGSTIHRRQADNSYDMYSLKWHCFNMDVKSIMLASLAMFSSNLPRISGVALKIRFLSITYLIIESCIASISASGLNCNALSRATLALDFPTCCLWNKNWRFKLLTSMVSRSIWKRNVSYNKHTTI